LVMSLLYYVIKSRVYLLIEKTDKILTHFGDALCNNYILFYRTPCST
jgi:hypothetical protein